GRVLAMTGGYDFKRSQFNRAVQARRQVGSAFKPFLFAAALEKGFSPSDLILDEPTVFVDQPGGKIYQPENYERDYWGLITLRTALEHSRNIPAVKLIGKIGFQPVFQIVQRLGIRSNLKPYPSLALGAVEVSLLEMTSAYGAFANGGLLLKPYLISRLSNQDGRRRFQARPQASEALDPAVAYVLTEMLEGVVRHGTAASISDFPRSVAGKTGTTDGHSDAWFIGYTPELVCGVWVGLDQSESIGHHQSGARAALPIWNEIMRQAIQDRPVSDFSLPPGVTRMAVDPDTGLRATVSSKCPKTYLESFREGTAPTRVCGDIPHFRHSLPYFLQILPMDAHLRIHLTPAQLHELLEREGSSLSFLPLSSSLSAIQGGRALNLAIQIDEPNPPFLSAEPVAPPPQLFTPQGPLLSPGVRLEDLQIAEEEEEDEIPLEERRGLDGRRPSFVILRTDR
ncbi:MAG: penicillin-binding transpeptidase domain-containing protein, partial [Acidobacteriota bacterium]